MKLGYYFREAFHGIRHNLKMTMTSISAISICLIMLGATGILYTTLNDAIVAESQKTQYLAFVEETYGEQQAYELQATIAELPNIDTVEFVSRDTAKMEFAEFLESDTLAELPSDIFRHRFVVTLKDNDKAQTTIIELGLVKGIAEVSGDAVVIEGYATLKTGLRIVAAGIGIMLCIISLVVINNALTASYERRKKENGIMRLCGVSEGHIRRPLVIEGFFIGLVSAGIAFLLLWLFYHLLYTTLMDAGIAQLISMKRFLVFGLDLAAIYAATGILLGLVAGRMAGKRRLRRNKNKKGGAFAL